MPECVFSDDVRTPMEMLDFNRARCPTPTTLSEGLHEVNVALNKEDQIQIGGGNPIS